MSAQGTGTDVRSVTLVRSSGYSEDLLVTANEESKAVAILSLVGNGIALRETRKQDEQERCSESQVLILVTKSYGAERSELR